MNAKEKVLEVMKEAGAPLNAGKIAELSGLDRKEGDTALKDFVTTGIDYLYGRYAEEGFFFMIEGGKIDYAGHNDDAASCFQEINDFAAALDVVLAFCDQHPGETLIVVTADHETGGLALGAGLQHLAHGDQGQDHGR